jgi:hypothetical protein
MTLAHIHNGTIIARYAEGRGSVTYNGKRIVSPLVAGTYGDHQLLPIETETVDTSTGTETVVERETIIEADRVVVRETTRDKTPEELADDLAERRAGAVMGRLEFARAAATAGYISFVEAAQWAAGNTIPPAVQAIIDDLPAEQQGPMTLDVLAMPTIRRMGSLMPKLALAFQTDDAGLDALYGL